VEFYLPTREECQEIVKNSEAFYVTETEVEGYKVELYDYRLASISDFTDNNAFELRGLCFVQNENGVWERNLLMNKFFNYSQTTGWMPEDLDNKKIVRVQDKLDGSVISAVKFPNGKVRMKSKMSFTSEQAQMAQKLYDTNENIKNFVNEMLNSNIVPVMELIGYENQIVVNYDMSSELRVIQLRSNIDGTYYDRYQMNSIVVPYDINFADEFPDSYCNLEDLLARKEIDESDIEGWIITFEDGQMAKIKTNKYLQLHGLIGPDAFRENLLVQTILDDNIDDVISQLAEGPKKESVISLSEKVQHDFNHQVIEYKKLRGEYFNVFEEDRKKFALKYSPAGSKPHYLFGFVMKNLHGKLQDVEKIAEKVAKEYILKRCSSLGDAKKYIEGIENVN
jgi:T4 RnlA family RNA ligase